MNRARLGSIFWKEFIQMRRDRATLGMMLGIPVVQLMLFGYAVNMDVRHLPAAVLDLSHTQESRALVQRFEATGNFRLTRTARSYDDALHLVDRGWVRAAIVIPEDYARLMKRGGPAQIQVLVDASDPTVSQNGIAAAQLVGQRQNLEIVTSRAGLAARAERLPLDVRVRPLYNPALKTAIFIVPGIIGVLLSNMLIIITAMGIVREREAGTLEQLIVTPLTRTEIMLGKIAPYVVVGYVQMTAVLVLGSLLFRVPIRGSLLTIYLVAFVFIVASLGLGLFVSTLARTGAQAIQSSFFFLLPNIMLSGFMFPREGMPAFAQWLGWAIPLTYFLQVLRGVILKGVGIEALWPQTLALVGFAVLYFTFAVQRFHKTLD
ncbi:MAG TPA: ABC transporter permease [Candidatus Eisenbacteria bacterium]